MRRASLASATALTVAAAACLPAVLTAPAVSASPAPSSAYAVIGTIATPAKMDMLAFDVGDDTLYAGSFLGSVLTVIPPGMTSGSVGITLTLPAQPASLAVDSDDDTVYVRPNLGAYIWATRAARSLADTIGVHQSFNVTSIAVYSADDTLYATMPKYQFDDSFIAINGSNTDDSIEAAGVGVGTSNMSVDQQFGTIWIAGFNSNTLRKASGSTLQFTDVPGSYVEPRDMVLSSVTHQAFVSTTVNAAPALQKVDASGTLATWSDPAATGILRRLSVNPSGTRAVFNTGDFLWIVNAVTMQTEAAPLTLPSLRATAQASSGLIYVGHAASNSVYTVAKLAGSLSASSARPGDQLTITVAPTPATAAGQTVAVDDSTLTSVDFGGFTTPATRSGINTFSVTVPSGPTGSVEAVATLAGGATMSLGNVDFGGSAPAPAPVPATAPAGVTAVAGEASAAVSWTAPSSSGSFPVSHYEVTSSPGGRVCLTASLTCTVTGLSNGTAYTFTVKALTGAGWSAASEPSNAVTPSAPVRPSITITGSREGKRIIIAGTTVGLGMGAELAPWIRLPGQPTYSRGAATILVSMDGTFEWQRRAGKRLSVYVETADGAVRSNVVTLR